MMNDKCHFFTEFLNPSKALPYLRSYAVVYHDRAFYVFGGNSGLYPEQKIIARLDAATTTWSIAGSLITDRDGHGAIFDGEKFLVIGGTRGSLKNEVCTLDNAKMTCTAQSTTLDYYRDYPELFLVGENYGKNFNNC